MAIKKKYQDSAAMVADVNEGVDNNAATESVKENIKEDVKETSLSKLLTPKKEELRSDTLTIRIKPSVRKKFEGFCQRKGVSRATMFEFWVDTIITK